MFFAPFLGTANVVRIFLINKVINNLLDRRIGFEDIDYLCRGQHFGTMSKRFRIHPVAAGLLLIWPRTACAVRAWTSSATPQSRRRHP